MQFRTKARAVDLLGKGQIADLPTAITELWKNGYDAYADSLKAELYLPGYRDISKPYFVISDDGKGMSQTDLMEKWLVLGTDSKSRAQLEEKESEETLWKAPRIKAGEKGIGRLSVAYLGSPMLMLTKKIGYPLQAMLFDWRLLENYNFFLDDITIPVISIDNPRDFQHKLQELKTEFLKNLQIDLNAEGKVIWEKRQSYLRTDIINSIEELELHSTLEKDLLEGLIDLYNDHGTKFLISEPISQISQLADKDTDNLEDKNFVISSLSGFTNPFKDTTAKVHTYFMIHSDQGNDYDLLTSRGNFFTKLDFQLADVIIEGEFDGSGSFNGKLKIYDQEIPYTFTNPRKKDTRNLYGEVSMKIGYTQGEERSTSLDEISFKRIKEKVHNYGGLYIYRDEFRVLPYGRENADFLNFEGRRSRSAGYYYFSYRRMYGFIDISRERNPYLIDKSSREGLINNSQYRAFYNDAINLFVELARDYFSTDAKESLFTDKKKQLNEQYESIKVDKVRERQAKIAFTKSLNEYPARLDEYRKQYELLLKLLDDKLLEQEVTFSSIENILDKIYQLDAERNNLLPRVSKRYRPTDTQLDRLDKYSVQLNNFNTDIRKVRDPLFNKAQEKLEIRDLKIAFSKRLAKYTSELEKIIATNYKVITEKNSELVKEFNIRSKRIVAELNYGKEEMLNQIDSKDVIDDLTSLIDDKFNNLLVELDKTITPLANHINSLNFDLDEDLLQGAYRSEYENIKLQWEQTRELAQLGIAVEIIDHEFNQLYAKINVSFEHLKKLDSFRISKEFGYLHSNFKQLESKYQLLSPLYRVSVSTPKNISGKEIFSYLTNFFTNSLSSNDVKFEASPAFLNHEILIKEPVIHTICINVVNNALYWIRNSFEKIIRFDYLEQSNEILIVNSGQRIEEHRLDKIFELFYSNRPNGRGIGLYLARQSLNECGFDIFATNDTYYNYLTGACFVITTLPRK
jgi:signal transduction histidine kinase